MRLAIRFDTGDRKYRWLNTSLFVAGGRLLGTGRIEYAVYRLSRFARLRQQTRFGLATAAIASKATNRASQLSAES